MGVNGAAERILNAAERLWASRSYEAVSLRGITQEAGVELSLVRYYFGRKEDLYRHVVERRAGELCAMYGQAFELAIASAPDGLPSLAEWIDALIGPSFALLDGEDEGWRNYARMICDAASLDPDKEYLSPLYDQLYPVLNRFMEGVRRITGSDNHDRIVWSTYFLHAASVAIFRSPHLLDRSALGGFAVGPYASIREHMPSFFAAAFRGLIEGEAQAKPRVSTKAAQPVGRAGQPLALRPQARRAALRRRGEKRKTAE